MHSFKAEMCSFSLGEKLHRHRRYGLYLQEKCRTRKLGRRLRKKCQDFESGTAEDVSSVCEERR